MKRLLYVCLLLLIALSASASKYNIEETTWEEHFLRDHDGSMTFSGKGTRDEPYLIANATDLACLAYWVNVRHEHFLYRYFKLTDDISLSSYNWVPIGVDDAHPFDGYFDGNNKEIADMSIEVESSSKTAYYYYGLFGVCRGAIRNLNVTRALIQFNQGSNNRTRWICAGLLCGMLDNAYRDSLYGGIYGCRTQGGIHGTMKNMLDRSTIGGIVGYAQNPVSIFRCHADLRSTIEDAHDVGGIVGRIANYEKHHFEYAKYYWGVVETSVYDCTANVELTMKEQEEHDCYHAAGICGTNNGGNIVACGSQGSIFTQTNGTSAGICGRNKGNVIGCVSMVNISGGWNAGGIVGKNETMTFEGKTMKGYTGYCAFSGHLDGSTAQHTGGIVGRSYYQSEENCFFLGTMQRSAVTKNSHPISQDGTGNVKQNNSCYFDQNMVEASTDKGGTAMAIGTLTSGSEAGFSFVTAQFNTLESLVTGNPIENIEGFEWQFEKGCYPQLIATRYNPAGLERPEREHVWNGMLFTLQQWQDKTDVKTVVNFPSYAAMAATPPNFINTHRAYELDNAFSLADKTVSGITMKFSLPEEQKVLNIQDGTALMSDPGIVLLTVSSTTPQLTKQLRLNITYGQQWDGTYADSYDGGNGSPANPFLIHNARQFAKMMRNNDADEYYKLTQDICFNPQTNAADGTCADGVRFYDNNPSDKSDCCWRAHLDGDGHLVKGLCAKSRQAVFETLYEGSVIENVGFVDLYVQQPAAYDGSRNGVLANNMRGNAIIRNCIFQGSAESLNPGHGSDGRGLVSDLVLLNGNIPVIEDCVVSLMGRRNGLYAGLYRALVDDRGYVNQTPVTTVQRNLILAGESTFEVILEDNDRGKASCYFPQGYFSHWHNVYIDPYERTVEQLTSGSFFTDMDIHGRWQEEPGYFPMLKSFAKTDYGRLLSLPFMTSEDNCLNRMKRQTELRFGAQLTVSDPTAFEIDDESTVMAPLKAGKFYLTTTLGRARIVRAVTVDDTFTAGVSFDDEHARTLCQTNFDSDKSGFLSINELRKVDDNQLVAAVNNSQQEAEQIVRFNEFALFRGITQLGTTASAANAPQRRAEAVGTAFHNMKNLKEFRIPESVTTIGDEAFKGCDQLETVTLTQKITSVSGKAFFNSKVKNILVDNSNPNFKSRDNMLYTKDDDLVCYPNGRKATSITLSGKIRRILKNAIYKVETLDSIFINGESLLDVTQLEKGGIVHYSQEAGATEPAMRIFVNDGSFDQQLLKQYKDDAGWSLYDDNQHIDRYYPLTFNDAKAATMYIGFATQLPEELKVYLADKEMVEDGTVTLLNISKKINNKLGEGTSVVVRSPREGTFNLLPYKGTDATKIPLYLNALNGVGEKGLRVNQSDSNEGNCLTLGRNSQKKLGFFYYKQETVKPFHAYLTVNSVNARMVEFDDVSDFDLAENSDEVNQESEADLYDDFFAYKKSDDGKSCRAVWYYGDPQNIIIPAEVEGIPVTALGKNLFYDNDEPIWSVSVPSSVKTLRVARREKDNPFYGLNDSTIVYLPSADAGYTMPDDEWNVVMGDQCKRLYIADEQSFIPPHDFYADHVQYTRSLWAETDIVSNYESGDLEEMEVNGKDGTNEALAREVDFDLFDIQYKRKAYTICLPFDVDLKAMATNDDSALKAYQLKYVKDNLHFIFVEVPQQLKAGEPYFIVVNGGGYFLSNDQKTKISTQLHPQTVTDYNTGATVGQFKGTFAFLSNDEAVADHAFIIQSTGNWHRVNNKTEIQKRVNIYPLRSYFSRTDGFTRSRYFTNYQSGASQARQRVADDGITDFPTDAYYSDIDFEVEDDATSIRPVIHTIDLDGTEHIYDLSGRPLNGKPYKGAYFKNGKKYINK